MREVYSEAIREDDTANSKSSGRDFGPTCSNNQATHHNAIQAKERQKKSKYDKLAAERSAVFVPFIATTFGGLGKEALKFIDMLSAYARHSSAAASHKTIMDDLKFGIAVKIQQGNYKIIDTAWRYHTRHRGSDD